MARLQRPEHSCADALERIYGLEQAYRIALECLADTKDEDLRWAWDECIKHLNERRARCTVQPDGDTNG